MLPVKTLGLFLVLLGGTVASITFAAKPGCEKIVLRWVDLAPKPSDASLALIQPGVSRRFTLDKLGKPRHVRKLFVIAQVPNGARLVLKSDTADLAVIPGNNQTELLVLPVNTEARSLEWVAENGPILLRASFIQAEVTPADSAVVRSGLAAFSAACQWNKRIASAVDVLQSAMSKENEAALGRVRQLSADIAEQGKNIELSWASGGTPVAVPTATYIEQWRGLQQALSAISPALDVLSTQGSAAVKDAAKDLTTASSQLEALLETYTLLSLVP